MADSREEGDERPESVVVPVARTNYAKRTMEYAVDTYEDPRFVVLLSEESDEDEGRHVADMAEVWLEEVTGDEDRDVEVYDTGSYFVSPEDYAEALAFYCEENDLEGVVLDPEYKMGTAAIVSESLAREVRARGLKVDVAPIERRVRRTPLLTRGGVNRFAVLFAASLAFYLSIGSLELFDLVTGAVTAALVSSVLYKVCLQSTPRIERLPVLALRSSIYVPYLLWQIFKANVQIAYVVLHPKLPIQPEVVRFEAYVWGGVPLTTLANSITLTPGTLTVESDGRHLHVHALTASTKEGLLDGYLERAVRFVFYGRRSMDVPTPRQRGEGGDDE